MSQNASENVDLRVRRSRKMMKDALIDLVMERGYANVTVQDIAARAMVNRATFYRHFRGKFDLTRYFLETWLGELRAAPPLAPEDSAGEVLKRPTQVIASLFQHIEDNAEFFKVMFGKGGVPGFESSFKTWLSDYLVERFDTHRDHAKTPTMPVALCAESVAHTSIGVLRWWLDNDLPYSTLELTAWHRQLTSPAVYAAMGMRVPETE